MTNRLIRRLDYVLLAMIISIITLQPYFIHGSINFFEAGQYLPQINEVISGGHIPYRDMFIMRGPLEILIPAFMMKLSLVHIGVLNLYFYLGVVLTLLFYVFFGLSIFRNRLFTYLFCLVLTARTFHWATFAIWGGMRFGFGILAILFFMFFLDKDKRRWLFLSGAFSSIAFLTSVEIGAFDFISIFAGLSAYTFFKIKDMRFFLNSLLIYIFGSLIISVPFILFFIVNGAFMPYLETLYVVLFKMTKVFNASYYFETPTGLKGFFLALCPLNHNFRYTLPFFFYLASGIYLLRDITRGRLQDSRKFVIVALLIYGVFLYIGAFRDVEGPQYRMALQPLLLVMFFYVESFFIYLKGLKGLSGFKKSIVLILVTVIPLYCAGFSVSKYNKRFFIVKEIKSLLSKKQHADIPYAGPNPTALKSTRARGVIVPLAQAKEIDAVVEYISSRAPSRSIVFTFSDLGVYNFLTNTEPLGRFHTAEFSFMDKAWFNEMMSGLKSGRAEYAICSKDFTRLEKIRPLAGYYLDTVKDFLDKNYVIVQDYPTLRILKRR